MKPYKSYARRSIGASDIASLTIRGASLDPMALNFGEDGSYSAYIVDGEAEIGAHYELVATTKIWLWVFDDEGDREEFRAETINVYRAGEMGCIIQLIGEDPYA